MNTCSTCKHWDNIDSFIQDLERLGRNEEVFQSFKSCNAVSNEDSQTVARICESEVYLISERSTLPFLLTSPDFGCTLWQGKNDI